ncbi:SDR family NAD(P)-dependent oxidoreductase [Actinokineospora bangkokensis]|uniref:Epimerase n=1 Tax=Actinokineospora bangkokensis TaxID=1193682 RepID=A0A1Q9LKM2_9PSEU|nr:SDR family NAD(P)-dependent oxidoreductase [Actinokineospora bangkokensis]OLR92553.1 epimerase [Actinokineospora bangkokensis]
MAGITPVLTALARGPLADWLTNPRGGVDERALREAVQGRIVLVTGASFGLGEATARRLAHAGATVLLVARTEDRLREVVKDLADAGADAYAYPTDLTDLDAVAALVERVLAEHGHVDVLVSNAGKSIRRAIDASYTRMHDFERTIAINYLGPVRLVLGLLPSMRERRGGHLVNISTIGVRIPPAPRWAAYQASKTAFDVFFRSVAAEATADGVTATSIYMALIKTRMSAPTRTFDNVPGLTPAEAAEVVCRAIVDRPAKISPWWADVAEVVTAAVRRPLEVVVSRRFAVGHQRRQQRPAGSGLPTREDEL